MEYTISPAVDGLFIILKVKGEITSKEALKMNIEAHALGRKLGIGRYLVDVTEARNTDTETAIYHFAYSDLPQAKSIDKSARIATLVSPEDHSHDFPETVLRNAGYNMKLFTDLEQAKQFLLADFTPDKTD